MKTLKLTLLMVLITIGTYASAQEDVTFATHNQETSAKNDLSHGHHGNTLNLGVGIGGYYGYYGYVGRSLPIFHINYEFDVAKSFTLAPFLTYYSYSNSYYYGNSNRPYRYYRYRETVIPVGVKATYYFDDILKAGPKWDFYLASSLGFAIVNQRWEADYDGDRNYYQGASPLFLDGHLGAEYHVNNKVGIFLDASTGVSTLGISIH